MVVCADFDERFGGGMLDQCITLKSFGRARGNSGAAKKVAEQRTQKNAEA
jgi:hypothetical protein